MLQLIEGAQAKALYGLTLNYKALHALVDRLLRDSTLTGEQVAQVLKGAGLVPFPDPFVEGFAWDAQGRLVYPGMEDQVMSAMSGMHVLLGMEQMPAADLATHTKSVCSLCGS